MKKNQVFVLFQKKLLLRMKLTILFMLIFAIQLPAAINIHGQVTLKMQNEPIRNVIKEIENQSNYRFFYNEAFAELNRRVNISVDNTDIDATMDELLYMSDMSYKVLENNLIVIAPRKELEQQQITGRVTDASTGESLPGVNVTVQGTNLGVISDSQGNYAITLPDRDAQLVFSFVGYTTREVRVEDQTIIDVSLTPLAIDLDEVVVVGYGTQRRVNLTGSLEVLSGDDLSSRPAAQTGQLLQGQSPSMLISMNMRGGEPGAEQRFQIRGVGSITGDSSPLVLVDGVEMDMNLVDPSSIENITILKDASASAVYGSRAAFGVILIQTKRGGDRPMRVSYSNIISANVPYYVPDMLDSYTYATVFNQARANAGLGNTFGPEQMERILGYQDGSYPHPYNPEQPPNSIWRGRWDGNANVNWTQEYFKDYSLQQKHNLNIEGGDEKIQYYTSIGFQDQPGILNWGNDSYQRYNILGNVSTQVTDWMKFDFSGRFSRTETDRANGGVWNDRSGYWMHVNILWPTTPMYNLDGTYSNPIVVALMDGGRILDNNNNARFSVGTEIEPVEGWTTNIRYNYAYRAGATTNLMHPVPVNVPNGSMGNIGFAQTGLYEQLRTGHYSVLTGYTQFERNIENHYFSAMAGYEQDYDFNRWITGEGYDLISQDVPSISTSLGNKEVTDAINHWATQGIFGRVNYNFNEKYLFEMSARYDGSSRFEEGQRWGFFPSASVGYNVAREEFWEPLEPYVQLLKLRASYGSLGNQTIRAPEIVQRGQAFEEVNDPNVANYLYLEEIPIYQRLGRIIDGTRPNYANMPGIRSEYLTWETVTTMNLGLEAGFFANRMLLEFDWFHRITDDMMGPSVQLPSLLGTSAPRTNNSKLETKGFELTLAWRDRIGEFSYNAKLGVGDFQTTILEYVNETGHIHSWYPGKKYGDVWGLTTDGIIQSADETMPDQSYYYASWQPGDIKYSDLNGDGIINPGEQTLDDHGDLSVIANTTPRYLLSFSGGFKFKSWDFNMFWQGIASVPFVPNTGSEFYWGHIHQPNEAILLNNSNHLDYWRPADETNFLGPNTDAFQPRPLFSRERNKNFQTQTRFIDNARYLRLKNLQIGYTLPRSVTDRTPIHNMRVYFSGENLLTFQTMDKAFEPESMIASGTRMRTYPITQMFSFGINATF
jgi:TonB-linked SusC/RagA family outer membrane protein